MCGFVGEFGRVEGSQRLESATRALAHRGPDGMGRLVAGHLSLGHTRLAITDTSPRAAQPFRSRDGRLSLVFNGEIFNFRALREALCGSGARFESESDTEVLLRLYQLWDIEGLASIEGNFAFALHDATGPSERLLLGRDPLGVKPLLIRRASDGVSFAVELRALRHLMGKTTTVDRDSLVSLLGFGAVAQPRTILTDVEALEPGTLLTVSGVESTRLHYRTRALWSILPDSSLPALPPAEIDRETARLLTTAVESQITDRTSPHLYLSGGIDSAVLAALVRRRRPRACAVTLHFSGSATDIDEFARARRVATNLRIRHAGVAVETSRLADLLLRFASDTDQPGVDGFNMYLLTEGHPSQDRVAFSATGLDELFFGYVWMVDILRAFAGREPVSREELATHWLARCFVFGPDEVATLLGRDAGNVREVLLDAIATSDPGPDFPLQLRLRAICLRRFTLDRLLRDFDACTMAFGVEGRVPFLAERVVRFGLGLDDPRLHSARADLPGRATYEASGFKPNVVSFARDILPSAYFEGPGKQGFAVPLASWLGGPLAAVAREGVLGCTGLLDDACLARLSDPVWMRRNCHRAWLLSVLGLWRGHLAADPVPRFRQNA